MRVTGREEPAPRKPDPKIVEDEKVVVVTGSSSFSSKLLVLMFIIALVYFIYGKMP